MITQDTATEKILQMYEQANSDSGSKKENAIKLMLRCKKMFEARSSARRILALLIKKEKISAEPKTKTNVSDEIAIAKKLLTHIKTFTDEHRIFKLREVFIFKGQDQLESLKVEIEALEEHLR